MHESKSGGYLQKGLQENIFGENSFFKTISLN